MKSTIIVLLGALALSCGGGYTPPDPQTPEGRAVISSNLDLLAGFVDAYGQDARSDEVAKALHVIADWIREGFRGDAAQLREAVGILRASLAEVQRHSVAVSPDILAVIAFAEGWLSGGAP